VHLGIVRGVKPIAFRVHPQVEITDGTQFSHGRRIMVGRLVATKLGIPDEELWIGRKIVFEEDEWEIAGFFQAPGTVFESEIWCDVDDLIISTRREEYSAISITLNGEESFSDVDLFCQSRLNLEIRAWKEIAFYGKVAETLGPIMLLVQIMVVMVTFGGIIAGTNTMYTAVLGRFREFGILRTLGFGRLSIMIGLCLESILIAGMGGTLGIIAARLSSGISLRYPMGAFSFQIDSGVVLYGSCLALIIGVFGAVVPGLRGLRMTLADSIRAL
jgi:ABC-type antimicrobial peptide transport system permease subunit